jgi:heme o synthase
MKSDSASIALSELLWTRTSDFIQLTKPKITFLVLIATLAGFYTATRGALPLPLLVHTLLGTALLAAGTGALNMVQERKLDALMKRTSLRPVASGRLARKPALFFAIILSAAGLFYLFSYVNGLTALIAAFVFASYILVYTPLKTRTWVCTLIGAIPGALPIVMGWTAASGTLSYSAWVLFGIVFLWQLPHFYSIGWLYREDYAHAGIAVLSVIDRNGKRTARHTVLFIFALVLFTLLPYAIGLAGSIYLAGTIALGIIFLTFGIAFARLRDSRSARRLFRISALYLPALLILLVVDIAIR